MVAHTACAGGGHGRGLMGLLRWLRGGDEDSSATSMVSAGLAEIDGLFRPSRHKQTEHVEEAKRKRVDVANGTGVDLERGVATLRSADSVGVATASVDSASVDSADETDPAASDGPRPRTVFVPRRQTWLDRMALA